MMGYKRVLLLIAGSLMISLAGPLVGVYAFRSELLPVMVGHLFFTAGYTTVEAGSKRSNVSLPGEIRELHENFLPILIRFSLMLFAVFLCSRGFIVGAAATQTLEVLPMALSGTYVVSGYVVGHVAEKEVII